MARKHIIVPLHIWNNTELSVTERLIASVVHGYTEHGKPCFMTNTGFSELLHISKRTASRAVSTLLEKGLLEDDGGGHRRHLRWTAVSTGGRHECLGGWTPVSTRNNKRVIQSLNTESIMNDEIKEAEKQPQDWQQVRDYFLHLNDQEGTQYGSHCQPWARDFFTYYEARGWQNKHGAITKWRPVALAWYRRSLKNVPQRAVVKVDTEAIMRDIKWHRKRYDMYERQDKARQASAELAAIQRLEHKLKQHG